MKQTRPKSFFNGDNYLNYLRMAKATKLPYAVLQSTYTFEIKSEFINILFLQNLMSDKAMQAAKMIEKDIRALEITPPDVERFNLIYYKFAPPERLKLSSETVYNVDIKMAYAQVLRNAGLVSDNTFRFMCSLAKKDRLACVGMLAANKCIQHYNGESELMHIQNAQNDLHQFFYLCISEVQKVMHDLRTMLGSSFLFYWVDGIYFDDPTKAEAVQKYLIDKGFKSSYETLREFHIIESKKRNTISYLKPGQIKPKRFFVPKDNLEVNKKILQALGVFSEGNRIIERIRNKNN